MNDVRVREEIKNLCAATTPIGDADVASLWLRACGERFRFVREAGCYYEYDGTRWVIDSTGDRALLGAQRLRGSFLEYLRSLIRTVSLDDPVMKRGLAYVKMVSTYRTLSDALKFARTAVSLDLAAFDSDPWLFNCLNGTIDLRNGELRPHDPADYLTKLAPVEYHPDANIPRFGQFLREVFVDEEGRSDPELAEYVQKIVGYCLTGDCREEVAFFGHGWGANGKSKLVSALLGVLGDYGLTVAIDTFTQRRRDGNAPSPDLARLRGARFMATTEPAEGVTINEAFLKALTGRDRILARFLHRNAFEFEPTAKIFLMTNHLPRVRSADEGTWRRIRLIPFRAHFAGERCDPLVGAKLAAESAGILAWAVRGALAWAREGLTPPAAVAAASSAYRAEQDVFGRWITERCAISPLARSYGSDLYANYGEWCVKEQVELYDRTSFYAALRAHGLGLTEDHGERGLRFTGVGLKMSPGATARTG